MYVSQVGFKPPSSDDNSYEADALPTKPPWLDTMDSFGAVKNFLISGTTHMA